MIKSEAVKKIMTVVLVVRSVIGFTMGAYEATYGAYFYERFGGSINPSTAILLATGLLAARQGLITLLEMPTGALADTIGRVRVVMLSWIARTAFFFCLAAMWFFDSIPVAFACGVLASIFWAIFYTCFNGAFSAWCADYLKENAPEYPYSMLASYSHNYYTAAAAIGTPVGILFYLQGYPFVIYTIIGAMSLACMAYSMKRMTESQTIRFVARNEITTSVVLKRMRDRVVKSCDACRKRPEIFWVVMTFGAFMFLLNIIKFVWPIFLKETTGSGKWSVMWIGLAMGCDIACAISARLFVWMSKRFNEIGDPFKRLTIFTWIFSGSAIISALVVMANGYATAYKMNSFGLLVGTVLVVVISYGFMGSLFETLVNHFIGDSNDLERATIISSGSFVRSLLIVFLAIPSTGSSAASSPIFWGIPAILVLLSATASLLMLRRVRREEPIASGAL